MAKTRVTTSVESTQGHVEDVEVRDKQPRRRGRSKDMLVSFEERLTQVEECTAKMFDVQEELKMLRSNFVEEVQNMRAYYEEQLKVVREQLTDALVELSICKKAIANGATSIAAQQVQGPRQELLRPHKDKNRDKENGGGEPPRSPKKKENLVGRNSYDDKITKKQYNKPKWQKKKNSDTKSSRPPRNCFVCDEPHWFKNCPKKQMANAVMAEFWAFQRQKEKEKEPDVKERQMDALQREEEKEEECEEQQIGALQLLNSIQGQHGEPKKKSEPRRQQKICVNKQATTEPSEKARRGRRGLGGGECHAPHVSKEVCAHGVAQQGKNPIHKEGQVCGIFRKSQEYSTSFAELCQRAKNILESPRRP